MRRADSKGLGGGEGVVRRADGGGKGGLGRASIRELSSSRVGSEGGVKHTEPAVGEGSGGVLEEMAKAMGMRGSCGGGMGL
jgi:hypothetical protein